MRHVWENPEEARARGRRARDELLARFTLERAGSFVTSRLEAVLRDGALAPRLSPHDARPSIVDASLRLAEGTGAPLARAAGARPTSYVRRLLLRALWPYLQDEERLLRSLLDGLTTLHRSVDDLERRIADLEETSRAERPRDRS
jgi:hypothetical protein